MREIVLDTETTGMDPEDKHRIVEIGAIELDNHLPTGRVLQIYINPERPVPPEATAVHGLTDAFLAKKPVFSQVYSEVLNFIGDAKLVIHNAEFDMKFINHHLKQVGHGGLPWTSVIDTLSLARKKFPGSPANLDALCRRFGIDNSAREYHGALLDSQLLAEVYLELLGGRQHGLGLLSKTTAEKEAAQAAIVAGKKFREPRPHTASAAEIAAHNNMVELLEDPLWPREASKA
jgi:DNA polymerase-3 subunit epsilon